MVWACLTPKGISAVEVLKGRLNANAYVTILSTRLVSVVEDAFMDKDFIFQQDNAPAHTAKTVNDDSFYNIRNVTLLNPRNFQVQRWFSDTGYRVLGWPPNSPDLSIIEHAWGPLKAAVRRNAKSHKRDDVEQAVWASWRTCISPDTVHRLYASMPARIRECLANKGGHTSY